VGVEKAFQMSEEYTVISFKLPIRLVEELRKAESKLLPRHKRRSLHQIARSLLLERLYSMRLHGDTDWMDKWLQEDPPPRVRWLLSMLREVEAEHVETFVVDGDDERNDDEALDWVRRFRQGPPG
jgi:hypothetical protein